MAMFLLDAQIKCLNQIFDLDVEQSGLPPVTHKNLMQFFDRLSVGLTPSMLVTGVGCEGFFEWQRRYETALVCDADYEQLKSRKGAYSDAFTFIQCERVSYRQGVIVKVARIADDKRFKIPLVDLEAYDSHTHAARLIESYAHWYRTQISLSNDDLCLDQLTEALA